MPSSLIWTTICILLEPWQCDLITLQTLIYYEELFLLSTFVENKLVNSYSAKKKVPLNAYFSVKWRT